MANNVQYTIGFKADNSQAKKALQELSSAFEKLEKKQISLNYNDLDLNKAVESAKELQIELNKATNINTGKLNLSDFISNLSQSKTSLKELSINLISAGKEGQQAFASLANSIAQAEVPLKQTNTVLKNFAQTLKNTVKWEISSKVVHGLEKTLSGAVSYVKSLNSSLNDIRIVTGYSADDMTRFAQQANKAAKELSTTTKAYADASLIYFQQGDTADMVAKKAAITTKAANVAFSASAEEMSEMLTAVWNSYQVGEEELEKYVDIMAALGAATATSTEEIATAMQKVAATANTVGVSMQQMSSIIATVSSVTREAPESIGTSFKTILARMGDLKVGKTLEDGMNLGTVSSKLAAVGVNILDTTGELKEMGGVIEELMGKWQGMTSAEKAAVAQAVAGKRQYTQLMALMENQDKYQKNMNIAENSEGTLQKQADIYAESWRAASNRMQASFEALYSKILNDKALITFANGISKITDSVSALIDVFGGLPGLLTTVGAIATKVFSNQINAGLTRTIGNISTYFSQFSGIRDFANKIGHGKTKTTAEIKDEQARTQANQIFTELRRKVADGSSEAYTIDNAKQLLNYKQRLVNIENQLNDAEKQSALTAMDSLSQQQQAVANLLSEKEKLLKETSKERNRGANEVAQSMDGKESVSVKRANIDNEIASNTELLKMAGRDDGEKVALEQQITSFDQLLELEQSQSKIANLAVSFSTQIKQIQNAGEDSADAIDNAIKKINEALELDIPENSTLEEINQYLDEIQEQAEATQNDLAEIIDLTFVDGSDAKREAFRQFNNASDRGEEEATLEVEIQANEDSVESLKEKLEEALNPDDETFSKIATGLTKAATYAQNIVSSLSTGTSLIETFGDESASLGDKLGSLAGGISSLVSSFMSGGIVGLAISAASMMVGIFIKLKQQAKENYQKEQEETIKKATDKTSEIGEEIKSNSSLIKSYNELYETYLKTGKGQEQLKESALELAKAYGSVGATLAAAQGNFELFNKRIGESIAKTFDDQIYALNMQLKTLEAQFTDSSEYSKYKGIGDIGKYHGNRSYVGASDYFDLRNQDYDKNWFDSYEDKIFSNIVQNQASAFGDQFISALSANGLYSDYDIKLENFINDEGKLNLQSLKNAINLFGEEILTQLFGAENSQDIAKNIQKGLDVIDLPNGINQNGFIHLDQSQMANAGTQFIKKFSNFDNDYWIPGMDFENGTYNFTNLNINERSQAYHMSQQHLSNIDNELNKLNKEKTAILEESNNNDIDDFYVQTIDYKIKSLEGLKKFFSDLTSNDTIIEEVNAIDENNKKIATLQIAQDAIVNMVGKNESTLGYSFDKFNQDMQNIMAGIEENRMNYDSLTKYIDENGAITDVAAYEEAKRQIAESMISEYTSLDDYFAIWQTLAASFNDSDQFNAIIKYTSDSTHKFTTKDITTSFLKQAQIVLNEVKQNNLDLSEKDLQAKYREGLEDDLLLQEMATATDTSNKLLNIQQNKTILSNISEIITNKDGITTEDYSQIYKDIFNEETTKLNSDLFTTLINWDKFSEMSTDAQQAYIENLLEQQAEEEKKISAKNAEQQEVIYSTWKTKLKKIWTAKGGSPDLKEDEIKTAFDTEYQKFLTWLNDEGAMIDSDGNIIYKDEERRGQAFDFSKYEFSKDSIIGEMMGYNAEQLKEYGLLGETLKDNWVVAEANAKGTEAYADQVESITTKVQRYNKALSSLAMTEKDLQKLSKDLSIDLKKLINMSQADLAKAIMTNLEKPDISDYTTIGKDGKTETIDYAGYYAAVEAYKETAAAASSDILNASQEALNIFTEGLEESNKQNEKLKNQAEILLGVIQTGELSQEQMATLTSKQLAHWSTLTTQSDRFAYAMELASQSADSVTEDAQRMSDAYEDAAENLKKIEKDQKNLKGSTFYDKDEGEQNFLNYISGLDIYKEKDIALIMEAYRSARSKGKISKAFSESGDDSTLLTVIEEELKELGNEEIKTATISVAAVKDSITDIFKSMTQEAIETAQTAADAWISAFDKIATARDKLLGGENLLDMISHDPETLVTLYGSWAQGDNANKSVSDFFYSILNEKTSANDLKYSGFNYLDQLEANGFKSYNGVVIGSPLSSDSLTKTAFVRDRAAIRDDYKQKGVDINSKEINSILTKLYTEQLLLAKNLDGTQKYTEEEIANIIHTIMLGGIDESNAAYEKISTVSTLRSDSIFYADLAARYQQDKEEAERAVETAADQSKYTTKYGETNKNVNQEEMTRLQEAIQRSMGKNSSSEWTEEDRALLNSYGITSLDDLSSAAITCQSALEALAKAAAQAAEAELVKRGYVKNDDGKYQLALTYEQFAKRQRESNPNRTDEEIQADWAKMRTTGHGAVKTLGNGELAYDENGKLLYDSIESGETRFVSGTILTDGTKILQEVINSANDAAIETSEKIQESLEKMASDVGMSKQEFQDFTENLYKASGAVKDFNSLSPELKQEMYEIAKKTKNAEDGFSDLQKTSKDTWKILKKEVKSSASEYSSALTGMKQNMSKIFNTDITKISNKFVEDHLKQMEKMSNGTKEEAMAAQDAIENDLIAELLKADGIEPTVKINLDGVEKTINILDMFQNQFDQWDGQEVGFTVNADTAPAINNMNDLLAAGTMTVDGIQEALNSIGWAPEIDWQDVEMVNEDEEQGTVTVRDSNGNVYTVSSRNIMRTENGLKIPIIGSAKKISHPGGGNRKKSNGGGGGGGGKAKKIDKKEPEDEKERYHHVNKVLERLSNQFDEIDKKKSRVYGKSYLDYISQEIALTEKQCDAYQRYIDEAKEYLALDTQRVASLGATFDEFGNIENYDQVMDNIIGKYNEFVDRYNAMSASEQEAAEEEKTKWDEWYEEKKKWIENYEETVSTIYEQQNNLLEAQNKISEKTLEGIQYKVEIHVDMTEAEKDFLDYLNDTYDELLEKQGDVMNNLVRETELATSNLDALGQSKEELDAAFASGKLNQANYIEGLKDVNEQILDNLSNIQDLKKEIEELYGNTLEMASDAFDEQTEKVKNASEAMSSYISILGLIGKGSNLKDLTKFYDSQYEYNLQSLEMQKEYLDILRSEEQYYLDRMNSAEGLTETERQQYEDLEKTIADVNSNILSDTESTLNQITEAFNNEIEIIFKDLEERIAGVGNSIQDLADAYSYYQEEQSRYVTSARELYEVNKLNRQIEKTMNETSSKVNKNLLAALQDRINKQSELNELTEYDIEMNQLQYELLLKKIALEEAQNAKSTVRLTRDSGGNYVYQYTADQDNIMTKQQEYEDVLQKINDLAVNRVQDLESQLLEIYQNTLSKIKEIAQDQTLTEEEKYDKIQTIMNQFKEQTNFIQEQYQIASDNLITSNLAISEHYGQQLVEHSENAKNGLNQTIAAMIEDTEGLQQALENACANQIPAAMDTMQSRIDAVTAAVNLDYNSMSESVTNYNKVTKDAYDQTNKTADNLSKELLPAIHNATTAWDTYVNKLKNVIDTYESMYQAILKTIQAQAKLSNATAPSAVKSSGSGKFSDTTSPSANSNSIAGSGGGSGSGSGSSGAIGSNTQYTFITYKATTRGGKSTISGGLPTGPSKLAVGSTGSLNYNPSPNFIKVGQSISDPSKLSIVGKTMTALAAGSVVVTVQYQPSLYNGGNGRTAVGNSTNNLIERIAFATGGLADFTGPAWMDGSKSRPEMVLNPEDTKNILTAVQGVRALDASTLNTLNKYIANASLAMSFGLGNISASSVYGVTDTIQQEVHITAEFPNATNSAEIQDAFDNIINRATQYITTKR